MNFKKTLTIAILAFSFLIIGHNTFASTGTIDSTYHYAWGENVGFIDFINVTVGDTTLGGSAYGENIGWIDLSTVTNDGGTLGGYAWGENVGFIDFSQVSITNGIFEGNAYGENIGWITFGTTNNKVVTTWRPETNRRSSGGSRIITPLVINPTPVISNTCSSGELYNKDTGALCNTNTNTIPTIIRILKLTKPQMQGNDVKELQNYLNSHSYDSGLADGIFGLKTKQAVIKFQLANQLKGDGVVGPLTRALLK